MTVISLQRSEQPMMNPPPPIFLLTEKAQEIEKCRR